MTIAELARQLAAQALATCDDELRDLLMLAAKVAARADYHGDCLECAKKRAEILGLCRPCYQRQRRANKIQADS